MVSCLLDIVRYHVFKGKHTLHIHIPGAGDEIFFIGVLAGQLVPDQVTAVIEILAVVLLVDPPGGGDAADALPVLRGHQVRADIGKSRAAAAQQVQRAVGLERVGAHILLGEVGLVVVENHIGAVAVGGKILQRGVDGLGLEGRRTARQDDAAQQQGGKQYAQMGPHGI